MKLKGLSLEFMLSCLLLPVIDGLTKYSYFILCLQTIIVPILFQVRDHTDIFCFTEFLSK